MSALQRLNGVLARFEVIVVTTLFVVLTVLNVYAVLSRYIFSDYPGWIIEVSEMLLVHVVFIGGAWLYRERRQIAVTLVVDSLSAAPIMQRVIQAIVDSIVLCFAAIVLWQAYIYQPILFNSTTPVLSLPKNFVTLFVPYAYLSILLSAVSFIVSPKAAQCP